MRYYNEFTTPSGETCRLREIDNEEYLKLVKWSESDNKEMFFKELVGFIKETIENYDEMNVVDKGYVMLAFCLFNVRPRVKIMQEPFGDIDIPILTMLDNIETSFAVGKEVRHDMGKMTLIAGYPKDVIVENGEMSVDYLSGVYAVEMNGSVYVMDKEERGKLLNRLETKDKFIIMQKIQDGLRSVVNLAEGTMAKGFEADISSVALFHIAYQVIKEPLEQFYETEYVMGQHVHFTRADFMRMTPVETQFIVNKFVEEKRKQNEEIEKARQDNRSYNPAGPHET